MKKAFLLLILGTAGLLAQSAPKAKNVILFIGDGAGISSLNAASIYGYGKPQALYIQSMPYMALSDTSTAKEWVPDGAASATAMATGVKTHNGVVSEDASAIRDQRDGETLKTVLEYAEEKGLSTGIVSNEDRAGVSDAVVAAFYAHHNNRSHSGEIFLQILNPKYGNGPDVVIGSGRKKIAEEATQSGHDLEKEISAKGYTYVDSLPAVSQLDASKRRVVALMENEEFSLNEAVQQAITRLSHNPKGFLLIAFSDCHLPSPRKTLTRIVALDKVVRTVSEEHKSDTLVLMTADHSFDLRIKGESLTETSKANDGAKIVSVVSLEDEHTAEEVPLVGIGPGAERIHGFVPNTDVFHIMMCAYGWEQPNTSTLARR